MEFLNTVARGDRFDVNEPDGWLDGIPYYLLNPCLHRESLRIDYKLKFIKHDVLRNADMYMLEE